MAWYYENEKGFTKTGVAPTGQDYWDNTKYPAYEFFQETDPSRIAQLNKMIGSVGGGPLWGPFDSLSAAQQFAQSHGPTDPVQKMDSLTPGIPGLDQLSGLTSGVLGFLGALTDPHTWLRVAEVILGLVLIAVGLAKLTNAVPIATRTAAKAAKIGAVFA